jgi:hypothetical protein
MTVVWDVAPCSLVEIDLCLQVLTASIIRAMSMFAIEPVIPFFEQSKDSAKRAVFKTMFVPACKFLESRIFIKLYYWHLPKRPSHFET